MTGALNQPEIVEAVSRMFHAIYQAEARRQAGVGDDTVRHPDEYDALPEHTKEYDRVLAREVLAFLEVLPIRALNLDEVVLAWAKARV